MPAPAFSVFVDTPIPEPKAAPVSKSDALTATTVDDAVTTVLGLVAFTNKENLDPITGERLNPEASKKRKNNIIAVKGLAEGKVKDISDSQPDAKKRKASGPALRTRSASTSAIPLKKSSKPASTTTSTKRPVRKTRRAPMPKLEEESEVQEKTIEPASAPLTQAEVDTKCKDLTVLPLADVSEAFDSHTGFPDTLDDAPSKDDVLEAAKSPFVRDSSTEPYFRDYIDHKPDAPTRQTSLYSSTSRGRSCEPTAFTTPERKQIWASFNFESPSPTAKRRAALKRSFSTST